RRPAVLSSCSSSCVPRFRTANGIGESKPGPTSVVLDRRRTALLAREIVVERLDEDVACHEGARILLPRREHLLMLQLLDGLARLDALVHGRDRVLQHRNVA